MLPVKRVMAAASRSWKEATASSWSRRLFNILMLRRRTDPIPGGLGDGWVIRATTGSRFIGWLTVKSVIPDRERKIGCNKNPRRRAEFLSSALLFKFDQGDECTLAPQLAPRCLRLLAIVPLATR